jgi:hypothetical protein
MFCSVLAKRNETNSPSFRINRGFQQATVAPSSHHRPEVAGVVLMLRQSCAHAFYVFAAL